MTATGTIAITTSAIDTSTVDATTTIALFHFDENFSDLTGNEWALYQDKTWTPQIVATSPVVFADNDSKFGARYLYDQINIYPQGWYLSASDTAVFDFGTGDYAVEFWMRIDAIGLGTILDVTHPLFYFSADDYLMRIDYYPSAFAPFQSLVYSLNKNGDSMTNFLFPYTVSSQVWYHICFERYAGAVNVYINGALQDSKSATDLGTASITPAVVKIGRGATADLLGDFSLDEFRVSNVAQYQGENFTPRSRAFGRDFMPTLALRSESPEAELITGMTAWYDADDSSTITASGTTVVALLDKSGNGYNMDFGAATIGSDTLNGKNVFSFNGSQLIRTTAPMPVDLYTIYIVLKNTRSVEFFLDATGNTSSYRTVMLYAVGDILVHDWINQGFYTYSGTWSANTPKLVTATYDGTSMKTRLNGTEYTFTPSVSPIFNYSTGFYIGGTPNVYMPDSRYLRGYIAEIIYYRDAHSAAQMAANEALLMSKWGL